MKRIATLGSVVFMLVALGCKKEEPKKEAPHPATPAAPAKPAIKSDHGVDVEKKVVTIGALNDESGPAAAIGKPYAVGKRLLAKVVNAGGSGILPEGWTIQLVERDHAYNPQQAVQEYGALRDQVLFIGTSFGTPNTLPLRDKLQQDQIAAFPASLSSEMAKHEYTPPVGASYKMEAMRALDWAVEKAGGAAKVKAAIIAQGDDYGKDGIEGWLEQAKKRGVKVVSEQSVAPGQKDFAAVVSALKKSGANYVLLTVLPSASGPILGTAAQLKYMPTWIGQTPAWVDRFFDPSVIPSPVFTNFFWVTGLPYWGEDVEGMKDFLANYEKHGKEMGPPDFYTLVSYGQGRVQLEALKKAIEANDVTRAGYMKQLRSIKDADAGGLIKPADLTKFPYETNTQTRVLKPKFAEKTWEEVAPYADPEQGEPAAAAPK